MSKPPKLDITPTDRTTPFPAPAGGAGSGPTSVPATITGTWDAYRAAIGQTVPANLRRVHTAIRALPGRR